VAEHSANSCMLIAHEALGVKLQIQPDILSL
jgi:hypothetical protein